MQERQWHKWTDSDVVSDEELLTHYARLVRHISIKATRTYGLPDADLGDIEQSIKLKLLSLPADKRPLEGYIRTTINNAARSAIRDSTRRGATPQGAWKEHWHSTTDYVSAAPATDDAEDTTSALDRITDATSPEDSLVDSIALRSAMGELSTIEREIVTLAYWSGCSAAEIERQLNLTHSQYVHRLRTATAKLRQFMGICRPQLD